MSFTIDPDENLVQVPTPVGFEALPEGAAAEILTAPSEDPTATETP